MNAASSVEGGGEGIHRDDAELFFRVVAVDSVTTDSVVAQPVSAAIWYTTTSTSTSTSGPTSTSTSAPTSTTYTAGREKFYVYGRPPPLTRCESRRECPISSREAGLVRRRTLIKVLCVDVEKEGRQGLFFYSSCSYCIVHEIVVK